tara:strand:- start:2002 stop:3360 length:1359 start_codon:yes stop_codon:yes gene_type:complete
MIRYIIPTYKRSKTISNHTLKVFREGSVPRANIWLFVANQQEKEDYLANVDNSLFGHIEIGEKGLVEQRNYITHFFEEGAKIVECDDDLHTFERLVVDVSGKHHLASVENIPEFCEEAFDRCKEEKSGLWGIHPCHNAYFLRPKVTTGLFFLVGLFQGRINRKDIVLSIDQKDDFERTCKYYLEDGKIVRFWNVCCKTKYYNPKGGLGEFGKDRKAESLVAANALVSLFPHLCKLYLKKKSGYAEVRLKDRRPHITGKKIKELPKTHLFKGDWKTDCAVMEKILSKIEYYHTRPKMAYVKKGDGSLLYGETWKSHMGKTGMRQPHPTIKGQYLSEFKRKNPYLMPIFKEFQKKWFADFPFSQVQINKNWYCPPHFDAKNTGESVLVAFGNYKDGSTCMYNEKAKRDCDRIIRVDARLAPLKMNGSLILHWVEPIRAYGDRYSLVFFNTKAFI